jgi:hypothetical protein
MQKAVSENALLMDANRNQLLMALLYFVKPSSGAITGLW